MCQERLGKAAHPTDSCPLDHTLSPEVTRRGTPAPRVLHDMNSLGDTKRYLPTPEGVFCRASCRSQGPAHGGLVLWVRAIDVGFSSSVNATMLIIRLCLLGCPTIIGLSVVGERIVATLSRVQPSARLPWRTRSSLPTRSDPSPSSSPGSRLRLFMAVNPCAAGICSYAASDTFWRGSGDVPAVDRRR